MTVSKTTDVSRTHGTIVLRGGRLTKWKGKAASLSPSLGQLIASVSPVALGRALMVGASKTATAAVLGGAGLIVTTSGASAACSGSVGFTHVQVLWWTDPYTTKDCQSCLTYYCQPANNF